MDESDHSWRKPSFVHGVRTRGEHYLGCANIRRRVDDAHCLETLSLLLLLKLQGQMIFEIITFNEQIMYETIAYNDVRSCYFLVENNVEYKRLCTHNNVPDSTETPCM